MYRMVIVDDDPLIQVGMKSMLDWKALDVEIVGMARNGKQALELIETYRPDLVFADIKMPVMDGLELLEACRSRLGWEGQYIVLTNYDDFSLAQKALRLGASDYLVKIEISEAVLSAAVSRAIAKVKALGTGPAATEMRQTDGKLDLCMQLLTGTGDDNAFLRKELEKYLPRLGGPPYCVMRFSFATEGRADGHETLRYVMDMTQEILDRTLSIELVPLGGAQSSAIVSLEGNATMLAVERAAHNVLGAVGTYFNSRLLVGIGRSVAEPAMIRESHHDAIEALRLASSARPVVTFDPDGHAKHDRLMASIKLFVKEHVSERITLQDVADRFGMSPNYLSTTFKKHTGRNLSNYMSEVKIRKAMELMQDKSLMVYQVAEILGYENSYYFSKVFKKVSGMTPKAFLMSGDPPPPEE